MSSKSRYVQNEQDVNLWGHVECFIRGHKSLHLHSERGSRCQVYYIRSHCQIQMVIGQYLLPQLSLPSHLTHQWQWFINAELLQSYPSGGE